MPKLRQTRRQRGGAHTPKKSKTGFRTLRNRPVGHNKPLREFRFESMKPFTVRDSQTKNS